MKGILVLWGSAPALAIATVLILNILSVGHVERGDEAVSIGVEVEKGKGSTGEGEEQHAKVGDVGIASEPEERGRMLVQEPSMQMAPVTVREAQVQEQERHLMFVLPYITSIVAASLSFVIVRRFVYK
ncbi:MAG: hypothetical protein ACK4FV_03235 [Candidatus Nitrosocaldus sp.]